MAIPLSFLKDLSGKFFKIPFFKKGISLISFVNGMIIEGSEKFKGKDKSFKLIYPNPENENKFVEIYGAQTKIVLKNLQNLSGTNPDYIILYADGTKISAGLFKKKTWNFNYVCLNLN